MGPASAARQTDMRMQGTCWQERGGGASQVREAGNSRRPHGGGETTRTAERPWQGCQSAAAVPFPRLLLRCRCHPPMHCAL
eukprot:40379-Chlamydomonas_euryale.AAC.4